MKKFFKVLLFFLLIFFLIFTFNEWHYHQNLKKIASSDERIFPFKIESKELPSKIAENLQNNGFIVSKKTFLRFVKRQKIAHKLQAGKFFLSKNLTIPTITQKLLKAESEMIKITFPEGFTKEEIDARLARIGLINKGDFLACLQEKCDFKIFDFLPQEKGQIKREKLEGFFFPDTFFIDPLKFNLENFTYQMLINFQNRINTFTSDIKLSKRSLEEIIIMASIIEEETRTAAERPQVADIFWKRLDHNIPLGADATVRYFTGNKKGAITVSQLQEDNPYNTRLHAGLTPTAICNPGLASIKAAIFPQKNDYWYFLHDKKGQIHFAKTLQEHNKNKEQFLY